MVKIKIMDTPKYSIGSMVSVESTIYEIKELIPIQNGGSRIELELKPF